MRYKAGNTHDNSKNMKSARSDTFVMAISLFIIFIFLFATESVEKVAGANEIFDTIQLHRL